jgi:tricorn protease
VFFNDSTSYGQTQGRLSFTNIKFFGEIQVNKITLNILVLLAFFIPAFAQSDKPTLYRQPAISRNESFFRMPEIYGSSRERRRRQAFDDRHRHRNQSLFFAGRKMIAFTGDYDGNTDVYVVPAAGGVPKRLTYHPSLDEVSGWTPDGRSVLFASTRNSSSNFSRLYTLILTARDCRRNSFADG